MALAHAIGDKVEAAYRRGDLFDKRRGLMDEWAKFAQLPSAKVGGESAHAEAGLTGPRLWPLQVSRVDQGAARGTRPMI